MPCCYPVYRSIVKVGRSQEEATTRKYKEAVFDRLIFDQSRKSFADRRPQQNGEFYKSCMPCHTLVCHMKTSTSQRTTDGNSHHSQKSAQTDVNLNKDASQPVAAASLTRHKTRHTATKNETIPTVRYDLLSAVCAGGRTLFKGTQVS